MNTSEAALALRPNAVAAYVNLGSALAGVGRAEEAVAYWQLALELNPEASLAHLNLAIDALNSGKLSIAELHAREAYRLDGQDPLCSAVLGEVLSLTDRCPEAVLLLHRALELLATDAPERGIVLDALSRCEGSSSPEGSAPNSGQP